MSSSSPATSGPAPWRAAFLKNVTEMSSPEFTLATLHSTTPSSSSSSSLSPRLRTVVFRGLWASLPVNPKNPAALNPPVYESDLLTLTTDARMAKVPDFFSGDGGPPDDGSGSGSGTGGGAPVEACFWTPARVQWRVRGAAYVLGPDVSSDAARAARDALLARMRRLPAAEADRRRDEDLPAEVRQNVVVSTDDDDGDWSFGRELTAHFGNLSPAMRGTFRNPPPGAPRAANPPDGTHRLGQKVEDLHDAVARANFRVVVVVPEEVDRTDLSDAEDPRRWLYRFVGAGADGRARQQQQQQRQAAGDDGAERSNGWEKIELWP